MVRFQEKHNFKIKKMRDEMNAKTDESDVKTDESDIGGPEFGDYDAATEAVIRDILSQQEKCIDCLIDGKDDLTILRKIFSKFSTIKKALQVLDPQFKFCLFEVRKFSWWEPVILVRRLLSTTFMFFAMICKPFVQKYLWVIITVIYIPAMYTFESIDDSFVLINPEDVAQAPRFNFASTVIHTCSTVPKGQPLLLTYSYQIVTGWYEVLVYAFTIGFTVRQLGQAQVPIYDWITVDELMDDECETEEDEQLFSFRGHKMTQFECMDFMIEGYFRAILVGKEFESVVEEEVDMICPIEMSASQSQLSSACLNTNLQGHNASGGTVTAEVGYGK